MASYEEAPHSSLQLDKRLIMLVAVLSVVNVAEILLKQSVSQSRRGEPILADFYRSAGQVAFVEGLGALKEDLDFIMIGFT